MAWLKVTDVPELRTVLQSRLAARKQTGRVQQQQVAKPNNHFRPDTIERTMDELSFYSTLGSILLIQISFLWLFRHDRLRLKLSRQQVEEQQLAILLVAACASCKQTTTTTTTGNRLSDILRARLESLGFIVFELCLMSDCNNNNNNNNNEHDDQRPTDTNIDGGNGEQQVGMQLIASNSTHLKQAIQTIRNRLQTKGLKLHALIDLQTLQERQLALDAHFSGLKIIRNDLFSFFGLLLILKNLLALFKTRLILFHPATGDHSEFLQDLRNELVYKFANKLETNNHLQLTRVEIQTNGQQQARRSWIVQQIMRLCQYLAKQIFGKTSGLSSRDEDRKSNDEKMAGILQNLVELVNPSFHVVLELD